MVMIFFVMVPVAYFLVVVHCWLVDASDTANKTSPYLLKLLHAALY